VIGFSGQIEVVKRQDARLVFPAQRDSANSESKAAVEPDGAGNFLPSVFITLSLDLSGTKVHGP